ncbi:hypothetical protein I546_0699 [Mycobacterium kansasii 732]|nr:hypothetical protein I546_0699 [Mycobacterium kansasii 732]
MHNAIVPYGKIRFKAAPTDANRIQRFRIGIRAALARCRRLPLTTC